MLTTLDLIAKINLVLGVLWTKDHTVSMGD
jgi:hypothetical protein